MLRVRVTRVTCAREEKRFFGTFSAGYWPMFWPWILARQGAPDLTQNWPWLGVGSGLVRDGLESEIWATNLSGDIARNFSRIPPYTPALPHPSNRPTTSSKPLYHNQEQTISNNSPPPTKRRARGRSVPTPHKGVPAPFALAAPGYSPRTSPTPRAFASTTAGRPQHQQHIAIIQSR